MVEKKGISFFLKILRLFLNDAFFFFLKTMTLSFEEMAPIQFVDMMTIGMFLVLYGSVVLMLDELHDVSAARNINSSAYVFMLLPA